MATNTERTPQHPELQKTLSSQICRFLFPRPLVPQSIVIKSYIRIERNYQLVNKYDPVIVSAISCNHDANFALSSIKVLAAVYYMKTV
jgi:hypothetical protein